MSEQPGDLQPQHQTMKYALVAVAVVIATVILVFILVGVFGGGGAIPGYCG